MEDISYHTLFVLNLLQVSLEYVLSGCLLPKCLSSVLFIQCYQQQQDVTNKIMMCIQYTQTLQLTLMLNEYILQYQKLQVYLKQILEAPAASS